MPDKEYLKDPSEDEERYAGVPDYENKLTTKLELAKRWAGRIAAADKVYKGWADRFRVEMLYQYYEGFQWFYQTDENNRPYVINMVYSTIENKLPNLLFDNPQFNLRARPVGTEFDEDTANKTTQTKEDSLNYVCSRPEIGLSDKHELAALDAMFGFGVMESDYSEELHMNPYVPANGGKKDPLDYVYCKQIPFDMFRASASANWDNSVGKWYGYYEFIPWERLKKYKDRLNYPDNPYSDEDEVATVDASSGKITVATESNNVIGPAGTCKIWKLWCFETGKFCLYAPDDAKYGEQILEYTTFENSPLSFLRFGKRRKGWYPYPPVWNWISPQDELNDTRQAQRLHRKRFTRKYAVLVGGLESEDELDKFLYGPDGTVVKFLKPDAIKAIEDAPMDPVDMGSLALTYDDFNRISGTPDEQRAVPVSGNRTTATQSNIMNQRSQIRDSKDSMRIADFMCSIGRNILKALRKTKKDFWVRAKLPSIDEGPMKELLPNKYKWTHVSAANFKDKDDDVDLTVTSISPINAQTDKQSFMEFLAIITQYEILAFSPALIREAAYRVGYKNEAVLNQFQQMAQLASIGKMEQMKQQITPAGPQTSQPGQLAQQQTNASTPPDNQEIMNTIFNRQGVQ